LCRHATSGGALMVSNRFARSVFGSPKSLSRRRLSISPRGREEVSRTSSQSTKGEFSPPERQVQEYRRVRDLGSDEAALQ
jgi:hypothetical protein